MEEDFKGWTKLVRDFIKGDKEAINVMEKAAETDQHVEQMVQLAKACPNLVDAFAKDVHERTDVYVEMSDGLDPDLWDAMPFSVVMDLAKGLDCS